MQPGLVNPLPEHQQIIFAPLEAALSGTCSWFRSLLKRHYVWKTSRRMQNPGQRKLLFMAHRPSDQLSLRVVLYSFVFISPFHWTNLHFLECHIKPHPPFKTAKELDTANAPTDVHRMPLGFGSYDVFPNQRNLQGNGQVESESQRRQEERFRVSYDTGRNPGIGDMQAYWIGVTALGRRICRSAIEI